MEHIAGDISREAILALRTRINDGLGQLDHSVVALIRLEFLLKLAETIKDRRLGMWASPSALETAALSVRHLGLAAAIESACPLAVGEEAGASEEIQKLPVPVTYWRTVLFVLRAALANTLNPVPTDIRKDEKPIFRKTESR